MIELSSGQLEIVQRILSDHLPDIEVRAFGSRVTGTAKSYSDLDLAVLAPTALDHDSPRRLREAFEDSTLPFRVDVVEWRTLSAGLQEAIAAANATIQPAGPPAEAS